jgi:hypothetical protein
VQTSATTYQEFLRSHPVPGGAGVDLIVANFAPLNLVADLPPLFAKFAAMSNAEGKVLVSVLNPFFHELLKSRGGWTRLPRLLLTGRYTKQLHGVIPVVRWLPGRLARQAAPFFRLAATYAPATAQTGQLPQRVAWSAPGDWARIAATQFLFLQFERA